MPMNIILSIKHTIRDDEHIRFWRPNERGYTPVLERAGHYSDEVAARWNDGLDCLAVPFDAVVKLATPTPYYKPGAQFYDEPGPVVDNTRANWNKLISASLAAGRRYKPKPEVFRGKRRTIAPEVTAKLRGAEGPLIDLRDVDHVIPRGDYADECTLVMKSGKRWSVGSGFNKTAQQSAEHWMARVAAAKTVSMSATAVNA